MAGRVCDTEKICLNQTVTRSKKTEAPAPTAGAPREPALLRSRKPLIVLSHAIAFAASLLLSFLMAHNMEIKQQWLLEQFPPLLFFVLLIKLPVFALFKQYRGWWRYVGISELGGIVRASLISTLVIVGLWFLVFIRGEGP